ncbi:MAG TPA: S53 family peptidase, partial [Polyangiaceae bacterium]|nr:S53 family peptidase [Polyangiaceae bacterium]
MGGWFFPHVKRSKRPGTALHHRHAGAFKSDDDTGPASLENGATPALIRAIYGFPSDLSGEGETIAFMTLGAAPRAADLAAFWAAAGIERDMPEHVRVGPPTEADEENPLYRLEATMGPAWAGAMAPKAKLVLYEIGLEVPDPWLLAVEAAVADEKRRPTVLCMTWTSPEEFYYRQFNRSSISLALAKAAALGITVVCASGDWGAYDGRPSAVIRIGKNQYAKIARAPWPHATFPSTEEHVLSVGGTMVSALRPLTEVAWSGPLPPDPDLQQELPFLSLATSGGFSQRVPIPSFQRNALLGSGFSRVYPRGSNNPAVLPFGRGYPDVALMAAGRSVARAYPRGLSATGYRLVIDDQWIDYAGGTSVAAPIWASVIANLNEARRRESRERLGFFNPLLYYLARTRPLSGPHAVIRQIDDGHSDIEFRVVNGEGQVNRHVLPGYQAGAGWDPATGLGVPNVEGLVRALKSYPSSEPWIAAFDVASEVVYSE